MAAGLPGKPLLLLHISLRHQRLTFEAHVRQKKEGEGFQDISGYAV